jgi:hypothetical protein
VEIVCLRRKRASGGCDGRKRCNQLFIFGLYSLYCVCSICYHISVNRWNVLACTVCTTSDVYDGVEFIPSTPKILIILRKE